MLGWLADWLVILIASRIPPGLLSALGLAILICMGMHMTIDVAI